MKKILALILVSMIALVSCQDEGQSDGTTEMLSQIRLSKSSISFWVGDDYVMLTTDTWPELSEADIESTVWTVENDTPKGCVTVDSYGRVYPVADGTATVTATITAIDGSSASASCDVTVGVVSVSGITLSADTLNLYKNETYTFSATVKPVNASDYGVAWSVKEATPAGCIELNSKGKVTAVTNGTAVIMATSNTDPDVTGECFVTVTVLPETITLSESVLTLHVTGDKSSYQFYVDMTPEDITDDSVVWSLENPTDDGILTITDDGYVEAGIEGGITVVATSVSNPALSATCFVEVITPLIGLSMPETLSIVVDEKYALSLTYDPIDATEKEVTWTLEGDNTECVEISPNGSTGVYVTGKSEGTVTLVATYVTDNSFVARCEIAVSGGLE